MAFLITYIPANLSERNEDLINRVKQYSIWAILNATNYIVKVNNKKPSEIRDELSDSLRPQDKLLVTELTGNAAWKSLNEDLSGWLKRNL